MSPELRHWIAGRAPPAVFDLGPWLEGTTADGPVSRSLAVAGRRALDRALSVPGRVRASAAHLLAADALVTYGCEAALDAEDPEGELTAILRSLLER